ncbi:DUF305 domain-containing protein [Micromonospora sp. NPDC047074]|uniref:DUF305 domain-containing protein n=1 Tax=Micromonospora sp. NPDC047074 TaxID=3154339 RepID=UPI003401C484
MRRLPAVALTAALLVTTGCAPGAAPVPPAPPGSTASAEAAMNGLDVVFLTTMVAHTERTLEITGLGRDRVTDARLRTLVAAIEVTEADELATLRGWLREAGPAATGGGHRHDHNHGDGDSLARLRAAPDGAVDPVLRQVLAEHQQAAADLARSHQTVGSSPRVRDFARRVEQSRTAEVSLLSGGPDARDEPA